MQLSTPVLFLIFNRPIQTALVFEAIREARPSRLFVAADGPRKDVVDEREKCEETRKIVLQSIDWPCEINTLLRDENLGCGKAVSNAITWFFENVDEGIILEDDCLPNKTFFSFCQELLEKYYNHRNIMHIGGSCFQQPGLVGKNSYYFSNYIHIWGWATWKRAWQQYNLEIDSASLEMKLMLEKKYKNKFERAYWTNCFADIVDKRIDTWDIQWVHTIYKADGLGISPTVNLISNIGFGPDATHTTLVDKKVSQLPTVDIFKISHPKIIKVNKRADAHTFKTLFEFGKNRFNEIKFNIGQSVPIIKRAYLLLKSYRKMQVIKSQSSGVNE